MKSRTVFLAAGAGLAVALASAFVFSLHRKPLPPAFSPAADPYPAAIYAEGIIESAQASGANINLNPEVGGPIVRVFVREGQAVHAGDPLIAIDDSIQRATAEQQAQQAGAAAAMLAELKAEPRAETLRVSQAQLIQTQANLKLAKDQWDKQRTSYAADPRSVSRDTLDTAENNAKVASAAADVAQKQYDLTRAGAWSYDVRNQERQYQAASSAAAAARALLAKYVIRAPTDGAVLAVNVTTGSYVSPQGVYDTYTQGQSPAVVMSAAGGSLQVRCYVDEILIHRLPRDGKITAQMTLRGSDAKIPLQFVRIQPYLTPKIELSDPLSVI